jgi:hypothetical protein
MAYVGLKIPPGFLRRGTVYNAKGRWYTGNFVRFVADVVKPVGGWAYQSDQNGVINLTGTPRGAVGWEVAGGRNWQGFGTSGVTTMYAFSLGTLYDISAQSVIYTEPFTAADGTDATALNFSGDSGYFKVISNRMKLWVAASVSNQKRYTGAQPLTDGATWEVYADCYKQSSGTEAGVAFLMDDTGFTSGAGQGQCGVIYIEYVNSTTANVRAARLDGGAFDQVALETSVAMNVGEGRRLGATIDHTADTITLWWEPLGGGTRTSYGLMTWTAPTWFTDGTHKSVGFHFVGFGNASTGWEVDNLTVEGNGLAASNVDSSMGTGSGATYYGSGLYGDGTYGSGQPAGVLTEADVWHMDNFGDLLIMCQVPTNDSIYEWNPATPGTLASVVANAPLNNRGIVVTPERFLVALGAGGDVRKVQWSDREDHETWTPLATNEAGDYNLEGSGRIMAGKRGRSETLLWTDSELFVMQYIGGIFVYSFLKKGSQCGLVAPMAVAEINGMHVWMGLRGFFLYDGYVRPLPCEVSDYVFSDMNRDQRIKVHAWANHEFKEVWWFYASSTSTEIDRYVIWNYVEDWWATGFIDRTCGIPATSTNVKPVLLDSSGYAFLHESGWDHTVEQVANFTPYIESGPVEIGEGDQTFFINKVVPSVAVRVAVPNGERDEHGTVHGNEESRRTCTRALGATVLVRSRRRRLAGGYVPARR